MQPEPSLLQERRVETPSIEEDPLQFLWAVSYCDLLMVLMCFFILFFQLSSPEAPSVLENILLSLKGQNIPQATVHDGTGVMRTGVDATIGGGSDFDKLTPNLSKVTHILSEIAQKLKGQDVKILSDLDGKVISIDLAENIYAMGQYSFPPQDRSKLEEILKIVLPYAGAVNLTFVGHSDPTPIAVHRGKVIDSNLVLSSLRATRAVEIALRLGFDPRWTNSQGAGEYNRKTRSLSIRVAERKTL